MTYEETIKHFKSLQKRYTREHNGKMCEKVALAIEAMEKQIAKKPLNFGNEAYLCPSCKRNNFYEGTEFLHKQKRCTVCGQVLDWEGANDE